MPEAIRLSLNVRRKFPYAADFSKYRATDTAGASRIRHCHISPPVNKMLMKIQTNNKLSTTLGDMASQVISRHGLAAVNCARSSRLSSASISLIS